MYGPRWWEWGDGWIDRFDEKDRSEAGIGCSESLYEKISEGRRTRMSGQITSEQAASHNLRGPVCVR